jgi:glucose-6-phosphate 1-dehydrogenase
MTRNIQKLKDEVNERMKGGVTIIVLGASGDLAKKKTFPALFALFKNGILPQKTQIVGYARTKMDEKQFHERVSSNFKKDDGSESQINDFLKLCQYVNGQYDQDESWKKLDKFVSDLEDQQGLTKSQKNRIFYMALPPSVFVSVATGLKKFVYAKEGLTQVVIEKPFGKDLDTCNELLADIKQLYKEDEVYRIDHYLGKELAKNIMTVRFANMFFDPLWDAAHIKSVQITLKEPFGTEGRGGYFDEFGVIRDVIQNRRYICIILIA